jgi:hypothetical protein
MQQKNRARARFFSKAFDDSETEQKVRGDNFAAHIFLDQYRRGTAA